MNFTVYPLLEQEKVEGQEDLFDNDYFYISLSYFCSPTYIHKKPPPATKKRQVQANVTQLAPSIINYIYDSKLSSFFQSKIFFQLIF